ncbi:MAG: hypothetical protein HDT30_10425 [Clostridiales bacterium]|nr:hypothetical protein [Clostridiales bacterium]
MSEKGKVMLEEKNGWYKVKGDMRLQEDMKRYKAGTFADVLAGFLTIGCMFLGICWLTTNIIMGIMGFSSGLFIGVMIGSFGYRGIWERKKIEESNFYVCTVRVLRRCQGYGGTFIDVKIDGEVKYLRCRRGNRAIDTGDTITLVKIDYTHSPIKIFEDKEVFVLDNVYPEYQIVQDKDINS